MSFVASVFGIHRHGFRLAALRRHLDERRAINGREDNRPVFAPAAAEQTGGVAQHLRTAAREV